ncbi:MAG: ATP-dependent 6-phosphofructokinase [Alphaproteobacteria bacterium]|nr:ATP-dependent 6-phosphofructokinase [Alphaproteobacteria bacterium]
MNAAAKKDIKTIAIFNSGGDCAGLNQAMYGIMKRAQQKGIEVYGLFNGDEGFGTANPVCGKLNYNHFDIHFDRSGTILGSRRGGVVDLGESGLVSDFGEATIDEEQLKIFKENIRKYNIDGIIFTGGDGSIYANKFLAELIPNTPIIAIPKTIDNDTPCTDYSLGFDTACNQVIDVISALEMTSYSHDMIMVVEVMGNSVGHIAINSGVAGCADAVLIPEIEYDFCELYKHIQKTRASFFKKAITIVVSEGIKKLPEDEKDPKYKGMSAGQYIVEKFKEMGEKNIRCNIPGHIQRGGRVTIKDKIKGIEFGTHALDLMIEGKRSVMVCDDGGKVSHVAFSKMFKSNTTVAVQKDSDIVKTAKDLGIYIGKI